MLRPAGGIEWAVLAALAACLPPASPVPEARCAWARWSPSSRTLVVVRSDPGGGRCLYPDEIGARGLLAYDTLYGDVGQQQDAGVDGGLQPPEPEPPARPRRR